LLFIALEILFTDEALVAKELDKALVAKDAVPSNDPVNAIEVTDVNPASVVAVPPKLIPVLPTVIELFAKLALVIPAVPLKLALVNPEIEPPKVIVPVDVIVPPVNVIPDTDPAVATEVTPIPPTTLPAVVAKEAVPNKDPVNAVEVTEVSPASVVAVAPRLIDVLPTVIALFAKFAFVIPAVPLKLALVNPEIDPPRVIVPVLVIVPPVKVMPETVPAVATEVTPLFTTLVAHEAVPNRDPVYPPVELTLPVTVNDPVIIAEPVNGNGDPPAPEPVATVIGKVVPSPFVKVIVFEDTEAVIKLLPTNEAVNANELLIALDELIEKDADVANELLNALVANDAVPNNEPVIPAVTFNEPVIVAPPESTIRPFFILNSFGII
jgi:hypothetical protein